MSMKKLGSILLSTAMVMSLAACGSQNTSAPAATTDDSATKEEAAAPAESAVAADTADRLLKLQLPILAIRRRRFRDWLINLKKNMVLR